MNIYSHRGFHQTYPENTLDAFEAAIALDVNGIETDIRITCDGYPVLYHNPQVPDGTNISALTQTQISQRVGYDVPRLEEAIALTQHLDQSFCWNLELKTRDSFAIALNTITQLKPKTTVTFTSFWHDGIVEMTKDDPSHSYGLLWASHPFGFEQRQWFESYKQITALVFYQERLSLQLIQHCHRKNRQVWAYGDRTTTERETLRRWGVDTLISDRPDLITPSN